MREQKKNYIPFIAGMATMVLLVCLISASLAKEDPPAQPQPDAAASKIVCGQAGIALFGEQYAAPGETVRTREGAEIPKTLTYTDENGEAHYYVEAGTIAEILDVSLGAEYRGELNCVDFGSQCYRDEQGEPLLKEEGEGAGEEIWWSSEPPIDFHVYTVTIDGQTMAVASGMPITGNGTEVTLTTGYGGELPEDLPKERREQMQAEEASRWAEWIKNTPLKPEYGATGGMYTEADPAEMDMSSFSGRSMDAQLFTGSTDVEHTFAFTPLLGEYAAITIENDGETDVQIVVTRPCTIGSDHDSFGGVRIPAGGKLTRAFRIDENLPLENRLTVHARAMAATGTPVRVKLTAEQYRFSK